MINLGDMKITARDREVLNLLVQGCNHKDGAANSTSAPARCFCGLESKDGPKRNELATAVFMKQEAESCNPVSA